VKAELRAITANQRRCESAVVRSSVMPSAKYSCSASPVMFVKGSTTSMGRLDGDGALSGSAGAGGPAQDACTAAVKR
jgi:hypothetical protein